MNKLISIPSCKECCFFHKRKMVDYSPLSTENPTPILEKFYFCNFDPEKQTIISNPLVFPTWCPLPDDERKRS